MGKTKQGGYLNMKINHLNARLFNKLLTMDGRALYNAEQGKILSSLWMKHPQTAVELTTSTGLAKSTLSIMLARLEEQGMVTSTLDSKDKRKKMFDLTELGLSQQEVGDQVSDKLSEIFYKDFDENEIQQLEGYMERVLKNLETAMSDTSHQESGKK